MQQCSVGTHFESFTINQTCSIDSIPIPYFIDQTLNHNKMLISVDNTNDPTALCFMRLVINDDLDNSLFIGNGSKISFQEEDVRKVSIVCLRQDDLVSLCTGLLSIQLTFCICC